MIAAAFAAGWIASWVALYAIGRMAQNLRANQMNPCEICGQPGVGVVVRWDVCSATGESKQRHVVLCRGCIDEEMEHFGLKGGC